jgi:hypothetical protein
MQYVFVETGNELFFSHIANIFCKKIIQSIIDLYKDGTFAHPDGMIDRKIMEKYINLHGIGKVYHLVNKRVIPPCCRKRLRTGRVGL